SILVASLVPSFLCTQLGQFYRLSLHDALPNFGLDVDQAQLGDLVALAHDEGGADHLAVLLGDPAALAPRVEVVDEVGGDTRHQRDRKSTRLNSSHVKISYAVF